ncbi:MAG: MotA/TolQ/ExbB proton channel family protein [Alphaproteobacteria bacterium]
MVVDGYRAAEIERLLTLEVEALSERHKRSAGITRRAAEVAPAMGLIGTLVGLVQMLADLEKPGYDRPCYGRSPPDHLLRRDFRDRDYGPAGREAGKIFL